MSGISSLGGVTRYWGLASGLNVESIVTGLTSDIQSQIESAKASQTKLEWKQDAYRDIISQLNTFQDKYLKVGSSSSMVSSAMYTSFSVSSSNGILSAKANSDADGLPQSVTILQSAKKAAVSGNAISGNKLAGTVDVTSDIDAIKAGLKDKSFNMTVDDLTKSISFNETELNAVNNSGDLQNLLNAKFELAFGTLGKDDSGNVIERATASIVDGKLNIESPDFLKSTRISIDGSDAATVLGLNQRSNRTDMGENLGSFLTKKGQTVSHNTTVADTEDAYYDFDISVNNQTIKLNSKTMTVSDAVAKINSSNAGVKATYNSTSDSLKIESTQSGTTGKVELKNDDDSNAFFSSLGVDVLVKSAQGRDAVINVNGTNFVRSSNNFTIDGVIYSINGDVDSSNVQKSDLTFTRDTDNLKKGIDDFISSYNDIIGNISKYMTTKPSKDEKYEPLTEEQQKKMTTDQIDKWNDKAKSTILYGDSNLDSILTTLRNAIYAPVKLSDGSTMSIYDMGITTTDNYLDYGKIEIKAEDTDKFNDFISNKTSMVKDFFSQQSDILLNTNPKTSTDAEKQTQRYNNEGIMNRINDIIQSNTGFVFGNYGKLIQIAGTTTMQTTNNFIYKQIQDSKDKVKSIEATLKTKQDQLYSQFQALESYMSTASSQNSMISSMLGSNK